MDESSFADLNQSNEQDATTKEVKPKENIMESVYDNNVDKNEEKKQVKPE